MAIETVTTYICDRCRVRETDNSNWESVNLNVDHGTFLAMNVAPPSRTAELCEACAKQFKELWDMFMVLPVKA